MKPNDEQSASKKAQQRAMEWTRFPERRIAVLFLYLGWDYDGLVRQPTTTNTIEEKILNAMERTRIIRSKDACAWTRCGRTDACVSAFRQVGSCLVRFVDVFSFIF